MYVGLGVVLNRSHDRSIACLGIPTAHCLSAKRADGISTEAVNKALKDVSAKPGEAIAGARLHPLDKGGQGIHIRGLGTKVVPELVLNAWAGVRRCG